MANLDYCSRETGLARGFAHYEDFPLELYDIFTRYVGLGASSTRLRLGLLVDKLLGKCSGGSHGR